MSPPAHGAEKPTYGRARRWLLLSALGLAAISCLALAPIPAVVTTWLAPSLASWILAPDDAGTSLPARFTRRVLSQRIQDSLADQFYLANRAGAGATDAERVASQLVALKPTLISSTELFHQPVDAPASLTGIGWCDPINALAASVLAREFGTVDIIGVVTAEGAHSFGRVWSPQARDWLYYDIWPDEVVVFRSRAGSPAEYLVKTRPLGARTLPAENAGVISRIYDQAHSGFVHNQIQSSFAAYVWARLTGNVRREARPAVTIAPELLRQLSPAEWNLPAKQARPSEASSDFVAARIHHLAGRHSRAREIYGRVIAADGHSDSAYSLAAKTFVQRLSSTPQGPTPTQE